MPLIVVPRLGPDPARWPLTAALLEAWGNAG